MSTTFLIEMPASRLKEREYVLSVVFDCYFGVAWHLLPSDRWDTRISINGMLGELRLPDVFFSSPEWGKSESLPRRPLTWLPTAAVARNATLCESRLPVIYGVPPGAQKANTRYDLPIDIFGSAFYMLSRYEEVLKRTVDRHGRFPAGESLSHIEGFLDRPIVDEYVEVLWETIKRIWPGVERSMRSGEVKPSCDVDTPFDPTVRQLSSCARAIVGDIAKRHSVTEAARRIRRYLSRKVGSFNGDPYYTFPWYLEVLRKAGRRAAFYFIPSRSNPKMDGFYEIGEKAIIDLMRRLHDEGHEIGAHSSYESFRDPERMKQERQILQKIARSTGRDISIQGNRQHYLRWDSSQTQDHLDAAGYAYDTSGAFADAPGFRYGTSRPFPMWSWRQEKKLNLYQQPLVVMETTVIDKEYLGLGYTSEALSLMLRLKERALKYGGDFTLLWHNSHLLHEHDRTWFMELIK